MSGPAMNGVFIGVEVAPDARTDAELAARLAEVCPVDIFAVGAGGAVEVVDENLDECVLCRLCIEAAPPGAVTVLRRYSGEVLE